MLEKCSVLDVKLSHKKSKIKMLKDKINLMEEFEGRNKAEIYAKAAKIEELEDELRVKVA